MISITCLHSFEFDLTEWFSEPDGEQLEYWMTDHSTNMSWASFDNATNKLVGTPGQQDDHVESFYIYTKDPKYSNVSVQVQANMKENKTPILSPPILDFSCYEGVECIYDFMSHFTDPEGDIINFEGSSFSPTLPTSCFNTTTGLFN